MDRATFETADPQVDRIAEMLDQAFASPQFAPLRKSLADLSKSLSDRYSVNFDCNLAIFDPDREKALSLLSTGLATAGGQDPHRTYGESTPHRYVVEGEVQIVPHEKCPRCWGEWSFKFQNRSCSECRAALGEEVKLLLDNDICPYCEIGKVSAANPTCDRCGFTVDAADVVWG